MSTWRALVTLIAKDLRAEWHSKEVLSATVFFAVIAMTVINFSFEPGQFAADQVGAGILWTSFMFAAMLGMNRLFEAENERGGLEGLMLCPVDRTTLYLAKCASLLVLLTITVLASLFLFIVFFNVRLEGGFSGGFLPLLGVALLGTVGLAALGTTFAAMATKTRAREVLLPLLLVPIGIPMLIAAVNCTGAVLRGDGLTAAAGWLQLLLAFDVIFLAAGYLTFPAILEE